MRGRTHGKHSTYRPRSRRWRLTRTFVSLALLVGGGVLLAAHGAEGSGHGSGRHVVVAGAKPSASSVPTSTTVPAPTFMGPDGMEATWVIQENAKPGTTAWRLSGSATGIAGFADHTYAQVGDTVTLHVSTVAPTFEVAAYRIGYYQGTGGRLVWQSATMAGTQQPACPVTSGINMVACDNWTPTLSVTLSSAFVEGDYLFKLTGSGGQQSWVPLTVWNPSSTATYVIKNDLYTWEAWNPYGGYDFYAGPGRCPRGVYPICTRARVVSFDRPYGYGGGAADFLGNEYPLVRFAEQHGLDVTYATDLTIEEHPDFLAHHTTLLSLGHDECWSLGERQAAVAAEQHGLNIVFFAASAVLRHVRPQPSPLGPDRELVDYRDSGADPLLGKVSPLEVTGNTWSSPPANWPEISFVGERYSGFREPGATPSPFVVADGSAWIFSGTGLTTGTRVPDMLLSDFDQFDPEEHPADLQIFAHSPIPRANTESETSIRGGPASDMTYYTDPQSLAGVFDTGTNNWIPAMLPCAPALAPCPAGVVDQMTGNLLRTFARGPAGRSQPSVANWAQVY